jgi:redox-sensitive bicupin YhaK (pirin superfamily)
MSPPRYQAITSDQIPTATLAGGAGTARVIAGKLGGVRGPAQTFTPVAAWDLQLTAGHAVELAVSDGHSAAALVRRGAVVVGGEAVEANELAVLERAGAGVRIECREGAAVLLLSGEPIDEPVVAQGPFVMNTREEIHQAIVDYQAGRMGSFT